jgi:hypothetical protein
MEYDVELPQRAQRSMVSRLSVGHDSGRRAAIARIRRSAGWWLRTDLAGIPSGLLGEKAGQVTRMGGLNAFGPSNARYWRFLECSHGVFSF